MGFESVLLLKQTKSNGNGILLFFSVISCWILLSHDFYNACFLCPNSRVVLPSMWTVSTDRCYQEVIIRFIKCNNKKVEMIT